MFEIVFVSFAMFALVIVVALIIFMLFTMHWLLGVAALVAAVGIFITNLVYKDCYY